MSNRWQHLGAALHPPIGCVEPRACPLRVPRCDDGYALASWSGDAGACLTYACDPLFSLSR